MHKDSLPFHFLLYQMSLILGLLTVAVETGGGKPFTDDPAAGSDESKPGSSHKDPQQQGSFC